MQFGVPIMNDFELAKKLEDFYDGLVPSRAGLVRHSAWGAILGLLMLLLAAQLGAKADSEKLEIPLGHISVEDLR